MNIRVTRRWTLQFVWWTLTTWNMPFFWTWPNVIYRHPKTKKPLFYGFGVGPIEFRWFDNTWGSK